jgi:hypothetical protein
MLVRRRAKVELMKKEQENEDIGKNDFPLKIYEITFTAFFIVMFLEALPKNIMFFKYLNDIAVIWLPLLFAVWILKKQIELGDDLWKDIFNRQFSFLATISLFFVGVSMITEIKPQIDFSGSLEGFMCLYTQKAILHPLFTIILILLCYYFKKRVDGKLMWYEWLPFLFIVLPFIAIITKPIIIIKYLLDITYLYRDGKTNPISLIGWIVVLWFSIPAMWRSYKSQKWKKK